jgi:hypothetical protein
MEVVAEAVLAAAVAAWATQLQLVEELVATADSALVVVAAASAMEVCPLELVATEILAAAVAAPVILLAVSAPEVLEVLAVVAAVAVPAEMGLAVLVASVLAAVAAIQLELAALELVMVMP